MLHLYRKDQLVNGKGTKLSTSHADVWGSGGIVPTILTLAIGGGKWSASRPVRKNLRYQLDRNPSGPRRRSGRYGVEIPARNRNPAIQSLYPLS
jgi:hypothetical protein